MVVHKEILSGADDRPYFITKIDYICMNVKVKLD